MYPKSSSIPESFRLSTIMSKAVSEHMKEGIREQARLYGGKSTRARKALFNVVLTSKSASAKGKADDLDVAFANAVSDLFEASPRTLRIKINIRFCWAKCGYWRSVPCEFGDLLNGKIGRARFEYACDCSC